MAKNLLSTPIVLKPRGRTLRGLRESKEKTLQQVFLETEIPVLRLSLYERGHAIPIDHLDLLSAYYMFPATELVEPSSLSEVLAKLERACSVLNYHPARKPNGNLE
jgi:transcriptional regulator with XRE-family HTH domain